MNRLEILSNYIRKSKKILIFTGAGISTGSGIPDYRGPQGFWQTHRPVYYQDFMSSERARIEYWSQKLEVWENFKNAKPNSVHHAIVKLEKAGKLNMVVTQNTDGLHRLAGTSAAKLVELHGNTRYVECQMCHFKDEIDKYFIEFSRTSTPPRCPKCGGILKPATISFGQSLKSEDLERAFEAAKGSDLVIALGSTLSVTPASLIPLEAARSGIPYIIINKGRTEHDSLPFVTLKIDDDVNKIFPEAVDNAL